jgi:hypothetical protein
MHHLVHPKKDMGMTKRTRQSCQHKDHQGT